MCGDLLIYFAGFLSLFAVIVITNGFIHIHIRMEDLR